ncbi:WD40 repeat-like protein [Polyporus arcularius HHB13444]|uniref:WD40 repeat-like protein n=1 Tax=Polyporus arcularius HHB13444 TaxID=1314778 RepID=A0A5C3P1B3_9APHY|nr:WD40 repeat-like protein [Polyporus arcularius HHB13444]
MPKHLHYKALYRTQDHSLGITSVAFSSAGTLLATAGLDGRVCIWEVKSHKLLHIYTSNTPVISLTWIKNGEDSVVLGYEDGNVATLSITPNTLNLAGFCAHDYATEIIANEGALVATAARDQVRVWEWHPLAPWPLVIALAGPTRTSENLSTEILVVSLHWTSWGDHAAVLVVCYQNHGIQMYESVNWTLVHSVQIRDPIARTDLSPDGQYIALYNLSKGIEVRRVSNGNLRCAFPLDANEKRLLPVLFIHGGDALVAGTTNGVVSLWHLETSQKIQDLRHDRQEKVLALAGHYDNDQDQFVIVTGTYGCRGYATLRWWLAVEKTHEDDDLGQPPASSGVSTQILDWWKTYTVSVGIAVIVTLLAFALDIISLGESEQQRIMGGNDMYV